MTCGAAYGAITRGAASTAGAARPCASEIACGRTSNGAAYGDNPNGDKPNDEYAHGFKPYGAIGNTLALAQKAKANTTTTDVNCN